MSVLYTSAFNLFFYFLNSKRNFDTKIIFISANCN